MKLSDWAKKNGLSYKTSWRLFKEGKLPCKTTQLTTGTILVEESNVAIPDRNVIYCRVSNHSRKEELNYQIKLCEDFCFNAGFPIHHNYKEIASGLNDERKELWRMIDSKPSKIIIENKDRLTRFGFYYLERLLREKGCEIVVIHRDNDDEKDLIKDLVAIIYSFCAKLYGLRRAYNKTRKCEKIIINDHDKIKNT